MKQRMYIDEIGNSDLRSSGNPNQRYLSLTGVIFELEYVRATAQPAVERLKTDYFDSHPDDPVIFHRKELLNGKRPFHALRNADLRERFNRALLQLLSGMEYTILSVVIDKQEHHQRYQTWHFDPYHYCLTVLVERFVMWMSRRGFVGDVMAESRGGKEDRRLKDSFQTLIERGTDRMRSAQFRESLTSKQLKVKPKKNNIAGLQIADLIAHPIWKAMLAQQQRQAPPQTFGTIIYESIRDKFDRSPTGRVEGWGQKWLP